MPIRIKALKNHDADRRCVYETENGTEVLKRKRQANSMVRMRSASVKIRVEDSIKTRRQAGIS